MAVKNFYDAPIPPGPVNDVSDIGDAVINVLDSGIFSTDLNICCPSCGDIYILSSVETFLKFAEAYGWTYGQEGYEVKMDCCLNTESTVETYLKLAEALGLSQPDGQRLICCNNDFDKCVARLSEILTPAQIENLRNKGIVEYSNLLENGDSQVCKIIDNIIKSGLTQSQAFDFFDRLLDKGLVVYCDGCNTIVTIVETFLKYWETIPNNEVPPA